MVCNGFPKSGNHALVKACELLGIPAAVEHRRYADGLPVGAAQFLVIRDPRNILVSLLRFEGKPVTPGMFLTRFRRLEGSRDTLAQGLARFEPWLRHERTHIVRYESLIASEVTMREMAVFADVPYLTGAWEALPGLTATWNQTPSDYRTIWTPDVEAVWIAEAGPVLLAEWGY